MDRSATSRPRAHAREPQVPRSEAEGIAPRTLARMREHETKKGRPAGRPFLVSGFGADQNLPRTVTP